MSGGTINGDRATMVACSLGGDGGCSAYAPSVRAEIMRPDGTLIPDAE